MELIQIPMLTIQLHTHQLELILLQDCLIQQVGHQAELPHLTLQLLILLAKLLHHTLQHLLILILNQLTIQQLNKTKLNLTRLGLFVSFADLEFRTATLKNVDNYKYGINFRIVF